MSKPRLFVLVSTGQNVANMPPVLEYSREDDLVLWVESAFAQKQKWAEGARDVLQRAGLKEVKPSVTVSEINDPAEVAAACRAALTQWQDKAEPVLVANGGKKLTPTGLLQACQGLKHTLLYGEDNRAELWVFEGGLDRPHRKQKYTRHRLDVEDILKVSGHAITNPGEVRRIWPSAHLPEDLEQESYGREAQQTRDLHAAHHAWAVGGGGDGLAPVTYDQLADLLPRERLDKWGRSLTPLAQTGNLNNADIRKAIYQSTLLLADAASLARRRSGLTAPSQALGPSLERAVLRRVAGWAEAHGRSVIQSVWGNVKAVRASNPATEVAQFDVLLVLKNGILLHIECKSVAALRKDLDARLLNLQQAGSRLARMALCLPIYTAFASEEWFLHLHQHRQHVESIPNTPFLPLTLGGQPTDYSIAAENGNRTTWPCPSFEEALGKLVLPYFPSADGTAGS